MMGIKYSIVCPNLAPCGGGPWQDLGNSTLRILVSRLMITEYLGARAVSAPSTTWETTSAPKLAFQAGTEMKEYSEGQQT